MSLGVSSKAIGDLQNQVFFIENLVAKNYFRFFNKILRIVHNLALRFIYIFFLLFKYVSV